jgi:hypothetical protein
LSGPTQYPEVGAALFFELPQLLAVNLADPRRRDGLRSINLLDAQAGLVFVQMLASQAGPVVVGPYKRLAAVHVIQPVRVRDLVADEPEIRAGPAIRAVLLYATAFLLSTPLANSASSGAIVRPISAICDQSFGDASFSFLAS